MSRNGFNINEQIGAEKSVYDNLSKGIQQDVHVCMPGIIQSINYDEMTVSAKPCIRERMSNDNVMTNRNIDYPVIEDIPIVYAGGSMFQMTYPLQVGDECLLIFSDLCIDNWWQNGGIQDQFEIRRHDLSDCFCIPAQMSQVKKNKLDKTYSNYFRIQHHQGKSGSGILVGNGITTIEDVNIKSLAQTVVNLEIRVGQLESQMQEQQSKTSNLEYRVAILEQK